jgi:hypothetical protein
LENRFGLTPALSIPIAIGREGVNYVIPDLIQNLFKDYFDPFPFGYFP